MVSRIGERRSRVLWLLVLVTVLWSGSGWTATRVALVVGNSRYQVKPLANPVNDARLIAQVLEASGFEVQLQVDADLAAMRDAIKKFGSRLVQAGNDAVGLFYFAGHGVENKGENYLIPIGSEIESELDYDTDAVLAKWVLARMERAGNRLNMVILDACRDNPFARHRGGSLGLAEMKAPKGTWIAYAAAPGGKAYDGDGANSPYTAALAEAMVVPGLKVEEVFKRVRVAVDKATGGEQTTWESSSLHGDFYFVAKVPPPSPPAPEAVTDVEPSDLTRQELAARGYEAAERVHTVSSYQLVVDQFPGTLYARLAEEQIEKLKGAENHPAPTAEEVETSLRLSREQRKRIQIGLWAAGFNVGPPDGKFGPRTRTAIRKWQASRGEAVTGYLEVESAKLLLAAGEELVARQAEAEAERLRREQEARQRAQREAQERARREAEARARRQAEAERQRRQMEPGRRFRDCDACPEMVVVPAGSFMMGSPPGEEPRYEDEGPRHRVTIAQPFAVGVHEVTRGEFARFVRQTGRSMGNACRIWNKVGWENRSGLNWHNPGYAQTDRHPVVCVSWEDARTYAVWLSRQTGKHYRLLSESEWEYAARGGTRTAWYWGESESDQCRHANGAHVSWRVSCNDGHVRTSPVGAYTKNGFGLYDVLGNVQEFVQDCWNDNYEGAPGNGSAWERGDCSRRMTRGGSWLISARHLRVAKRSMTATGYRYFHMGFRIARTLTP